MKNTKSVFKIIGIFGLQLILSPQIWAACECASLGNNKNSGCKLKPTVYYKPEVSVDESKCTSNRLRKMKIRIIDEQTKKTIRKEEISMCRLDHNNCVMQGTCSVENKGKKMTLSYRGRSSKTKTTFWESVTCVYGKGAGGECIDPFFTVAADLTHHEIGDMIFVKDLVGKKLPDGRIHDGYFTISDTGGRITGINRFDFHTGYMTPDNPANLFTNPQEGLGLGDIQSKVSFCKISSEFSSKRIKEILLARNRTTQPTTQNTVPSDFDPFSGQQ